MTDITLERIYYQLAMGNVGMALAETDTYLSAWPNPQSREKLEELKAEYKLMESYWLQGMKDPQRDEQYQRLLQRVYVLCANIAIHRHMTSSSYLQQLYKQVRQSGRNWSLDNIRHELEGFVTDVAMLQLEPEDVRTEKSKEIYKQHQQQMNDLFNYIVTSRVWTAGVGQGMEEILLSPTVDTIDQQLLVSAVTLSLMNCFEIVKFRLLVNVYQQSHDEEVRQRALVGWVLSLDDDSLKIYPEQFQLIADLLQSKKACRELTELQMQLVYAQNAEKDTTTIREEIMPDLMKNNQFRMTPNGLEEVEDNELEDVLHPDAAEERMEKLEASFQRMMNMEKQGADIYFGGFSQMKRFPFFYDMSNWLVPFYLQHPDIAQFMQKLGDNRFALQLVERGPFCNSDKYSLIMTVQNALDMMPPSMRAIIDRGETRFDAVSEDELHDPAYVRRIYLMDLYRFFKLFPNRSVLFNPFDTAKSELGRCMFFTSRLMTNTPLEEHKREVVAMLLKQKYRKTTENLLQTFPPQMQDVQYYLWAGNYREALKLDSDNEQALKGVARQAYDSGRFDDAYNAYEHLLLLHPEKKGYMLNKAICQVEMKEYEEALQLLYQLNYEQPENERVSRVLGWTLLCDGKLEQATKVYDELNNQGKLSGEDYQNRGYCLWFVGRIGEAVDSFRQYQKVPGYMPDMLLRDHALVEKYGLSDIDIRMMESLVAA